MKSKKRIKWNTELALNYIKENHPNSEIIGDFEYKNMRQRISIRCKKCGYIREVDLAKFFYSKESCDGCSGTKKKTIEEIKSDVLKFGFIVLSNEYKGNSHELFLKDKEGYKYTSSYANIIKRKSAKRFHKSNIFSIENIKLWLIKNNKPYELISTKYINNSQRLEFICKIHHEKFTSRWIEISKSERNCPICINEYKRSLAISKIDERKERILKLNPNISIDFNGYENVNSEIIATCKIHGNKWTTTAHYLQLNRGCPICYAERMSNKNRMTVDELEEKINLNSPNLEILDIDKYKNNKSKLTARCKIHNIKFKTSAFNLMSKGECCEKCKTENRSGENSSSWNPNLTEEDRVKGRKIKDKVTGMTVPEWRTSVYERDDYTCDICGNRGDKLNAHHKDSWNWCKDRRFDIDNGVTLCLKCHKEFHRIHGKCDNTEEQYLEFKRNKMKEVI